MWKSPEYRKKIATKKKQGYLENLRIDKKGRKSGVGYQSNIGVDGLKDPPKKRRKVPTCKQCGEDGHASHNAKKCIYNSRNPKYKGPFVPPVVPNPSQDDAGTGDGEDGGDSKDGGDSDEEIMKI